MRKFAHRYLDIHPWSLMETDFHPERSRVSESLFSLANEHMGIRGYFEEGYSGDTLRGCYVNGVFEEQKTRKSYRGISDRVCFMVNTLDWLHTRIRIDGELLDLATSRYSGFERKLDFRTGLLSRSYTWITEKSGRISVLFERLLSMERIDTGALRITFNALDTPCRLEIETGLDFSIPHEVYERNYWNCATLSKEPDGASISAVTVSTGKSLHAAFQMRGIDMTRAEFMTGEKYAGRRFTLSLKPGTPVSIEKHVVLKPDRPGAQPGDSGSGRTPGFDTLLEENRAYWIGVWERSDIKIEGDPENQQGIRFSIFQLQQTFHGKVPGANIGAKGLTGEFYNGNAFWDTEVYCLPYYLFTNPATARELLEFRHRTLKQAQERARELDCGGACYPVATIDGTESCTLWQHASLQFQPTTSVAYAISHYVRVTGDTDYLFTHGVEMLVQIARFLATRVQWSERKQAYGYYCVMGPDEFQMMVNHNAYTNFMGARSLEFAADAIEDLRRNAPGKYSGFAAAVGLAEGETATWRNIAAKMYIPRDPRSLLIEQHEGFFDLPHVDIKSIPPEEFPLYHSWSYDRIYRNDMIKQADVLMFMFLYSSWFSFEEKLENYNYYEPRCIHESSLSPSVHSIIASELGKAEEACDFFRFATRIDLDDYNRNTREGLHMTAIAAAWMNIIYGFGGLRSDGDHLVLRPTLPDTWKSLTFRLSYRGSLVEVKVEQSGSLVTLIEGNPVSLELYGSTQTLQSVGKPLYLAAGGVRV